MTRVHLMYGLSGSGKTTLARQLAAERPAVRFTLDEWMLRLYPDLRFDSSEYGVLAAHVRDLIWDVASQVLVSDTDVVLDWNFWSIDRRAWAVERASALGAEVVLHRIDASVDVASHQAADRSRSGHPYAHPVTREGNEHLAGLLQEPRQDEGFAIVRHGPADGQSARRK